MKDKFTYFHSESTRDETLLSQIKHFVDITQNTEVL